MTADELIEKEFQGQMAMWGANNERADATDNQLTLAAAAQLTLVVAKHEGAPVKEAISKIQKDVYPSDWNGFRDYGSQIANLVVAAAYIKSEINRRLKLGEDTTRTKRGEPYGGPDFPSVSFPEG
jgi:hypothetical protein